LQKLVRILTNQKGFSMIVITRKVIGTNEIVVTFKKGSDVTKLGSTSSISVLDAIDEKEAVCIAIKESSIVEFLESN